ncbi:MerC mercury resistance protein [Flavobacterium micromati]|uniref:MerC mercury resistance protein n=2 Tax=Flavobacterium micromati TaxID=229205 RepID=A0A1M5KP39_9FLAO|nr:MerC mercury resistance protein [Flavobacterium micromati]
MIEMKNSTTKPYDVLGISSATLCLIHCIVFPILTIVPFGFSNSVFIDSLFASIGMLVVSKVLMSNATVTVKYILGIAILVIVVSVVLDLIFHIHTELIVIGGLGMIVGHILNFKNHKKKHL